MTQVVMRWMGKDGERQTKPRSLTPVGILPCGLVPNRPRDGTGTGPGTRLGTPAV